MDQNKLERLETIRKFLEIDDHQGLNRFIDRIAPNVKKDEDFQDIIEEIKSKNFEQALYLTEDIIYEIKDSDFDQDYEDEISIDDFEEKDDYGIDEDSDFEDLKMNDFDDLDFIDDKDEDDDLF